MSAGFTPGPLVVRKSPGNIIPPFFDVERADAPGCVARCFPSDTAEDDATLYAAAPDLYEAAAKLIANFDELRATTVAERFVTGRSDAEIRKSSNEAIEQLRAAIAKANGQ